MLTAVSSVFAACDDCSQRKNAATKKRRPMTPSDHDTTLHPFQLVVKRGFDIVVSAAGLIVLSPLFLLISVAIKLGSRGPIFSARYEYCYNDQRIRTIKFRTIGSLFFTTRIGHFLIQSGIERLPMLINVLRGEMSIVGPRCHITLPSIPGSDQLMLALLNSPFKPGLLSFGGPHERGQIEADLFYVSNWSLLLDAKILFGYLFSKGAYTATSLRG
jgi:lipopolysaccharide/colanic/teichoic acid biosynthesis glycosyltransferase